MVATRKFDKNNNLIYIKDGYGNENWYKYDENDNNIYTIYSNGKERWCRYDENNNEIHWKHSNGEEEWYKWENNNRIDISQQEFKQIERIKLYFNNKKINRFEIMDI